MNGQESVSRGGAREYLRAFRRHRILVLLTVIVCGAGVYAYSASRPKTYVATASLLFEDPNEDLSLTGTSGGVFRTAQERAQIGADTIVTPRLARRVKRRVETSLSAATIEDNLSASADPASSQVRLTASAPHAALSARLANAAAGFAATSQADAERARYRHAAARLQRKADALGKEASAGDPKKLDPAAIQQRAADNSQRLIYNDQITRLRTLSTLAQPVEVSKTASIPSSATSPKPVRDGIVAALVGLVLGFMLSLALDRFTRRLRSTQDVEDVLGLPVLTHIGADALGKAGLSTRGRGALSGPDFEAFRILRTSLRFQNLDNPPKTILVTSPMPEEGKSTVAASLAYSCAMAGRRTLLLECDFRRPALAERLGLEREPGLIDYLTDRATPEDVLQRVPEVHGDPTANGGDPSATEAPGAPLAAIVLGSAEHGEPAELLETFAFEQFFAEVAASYETIIVDTAPVLPVADTLELLPHVDSVVLCVRSGRTTRDQAAAAKASLGPVQDRIVGTVVTGVSARERTEYSYYGYYGYRYESSEAEEPKEEAGGLSGGLGRLRRRLTPARD